MTDKKITLTRDDVVRLLDGSTVDSVKITHNTVLFFEMPNDYSFGVVAGETIEFLSKVIRDRTGFNVGIVVLPYGTDIKKLKQRELEELRREIDLMLAHLAVVAKNKRNQN